MTKTFHDKTLFGFSNFGHWKLFDICNFNNSMNFQQGKPLPGEPNAGPSEPGYLLWKNLAWVEDHIRIENIFYFGLKPDTFR
jgi:hypothetical protein